MTDSSRDVRDNTEGSKKNRWTEYMFDLYRSRKPPVLGTVDVQTIEDLAREKMSRVGRSGTFIPPTISESYIY